MAFRYFIRYLASVTWSFFEEFRNFLFFGSFLAFLTSYLQSRLLQLCVERVRGGDDICLPGPKPWCYLGWIYDDVAGEDAAGGNMAPTSVATSCDQRKGKVEEGTDGATNRKQDASVKRFMPLVVTFVGLPARGKTIAALKLAKYLAWIGYKTKVFSTSEYRRKLPDQSGGDEVIGRKSLTEAAAAAEEWLQAGGEAAILDGTNATQSKRQWVYENFNSQSGYKVLFVECVCDKEEQLTKNVKEILKSSPDYSNMTFDKALDHFTKKVQHYVKVYQPMRTKQEPNLSFIKYVNQGEDISIHRVAGQMQSCVLTFMTNYSAVPRTLYFSRHGESEYNVVGRIGGDTQLSPRGQLYGQTLARHINEAQIPNLRVWTSTLRRTQQTAHAICAPKESLPELNELDAGVCEGLTYEEMAEKYPQEFAWRDQDKLRYRYPWGESYIDIMRRVAPVLLELEAQDNVLVVSHQAVLRCIIGYLLGKAQEELPYMEVPLHTIMKLTTDGYTYNMEFIKLPVECVNTTRKQPANCSTQRSIDEALLTIPAHFDAHFDTNKMWQMMGSSPLLN